MQGMGDTDIIRQAFKPQCVFLVESEDMWRVGPITSTKGVSGRVLFLLSECELEKVNSHALFSLHSHSHSRGTGLYSKKQTDLRALLKE